MIINVNLAIAAFALVPINVCFYIFFKQKMKRAFKKNRARIADINAGIEDNFIGY